MTEETMEKSMEETQEEQKQDADEELFDSISEDVEEEEVKPVSDIPVKKEDDEVFSSNNMRTQKVDWDNLPQDDKLKPAPRELLDGQIVPITDAEMYVETEGEFKKSLNGETEYKPTQFVVMFGNEGQGEYYSGVRNFKNRDGKLNPIPNIYPEGTSQASELLKKYAEFKGVAPTMIRISEFMKDLKSGQLMVEIETKDVKNPTTGTSIKKNFVKRFVKQ